jgi:glycosyltransferase involved in cell wall biosynthesis
MKLKKSLKRRILFVAPLPPPYAGPEVANETLINSSLREQFELICLKSNLNLTNTNKGKVTLRSFFALFILIFRMIGLIVFRQPDIVYTLLSQNFSGFIRDSLFVLITKMSGRRLVLHFRGSNFGNFYDRQNIIFKKYIKFILTLTDTLIIEAFWVKNIFTQFIPAHKIKIIYNPVPVIIYQGYIPKKRCIPRDIIKVLYMGSVSVAKGAGLLLKAIKEMVPLNKKLRFIIVGGIIAKERNILTDKDGANIVFDDIDFLIKDINGSVELNRCVEFKGIVSQQEKLGLLRESDIFVLPSYSEGCPISILEALACGLALVVTPVGALSEILESGKNCFFSKVGDYNDFKNKLMCLTQDESLLDTMSFNNRRLAEQKFSVEVISPMFTEVFKG